MRYETTIKYLDKQITMKVPYKALGGTFELPEFLKFVRLIFKCNIIYIHQILDYPTDKCFAYEKGTEKIPRDYLIDFARLFKLPAKLKYLGIVEETENKKIFAERLKIERLKKQLPQEFAAMDLDIKRSTYACYEAAKNTPNFDTLIKIADYYEVSLDYLTGRDKFLK